MDETGNLVSGRFWVHIADAAALASPHSAIDLEGVRPCATLYLPEGAVTMLPPQIIPTLGLGLQEISPALSFQITITAAGEISGIEIQPTWVKVQRLSYEQAEEMLEQEPLRSLQKICLVYQARRRKNGALFINLPEVNMRVIDGRVEIRPVKHLRSRELVREAMLMAGEAAAHYAIQAEIPFPYATQAATGDLLKASEDPSDLAGPYAMRRTLKRSQVSGQPGLHAGVGLPAYSRVTSPLRRYLGPGRSPAIAGSTHTPPFAQ